MDEKRFFSTRNITYLAVLLSFVVVFQVLSGFMVIGATRFCLVLVPIVLGGIILGVRAGAFLGFAFGAVVILDALLGLDPTTLIMLNDMPLLTCLLCIGKGVAAGVVPALLYKIIAKKNTVAAIFVAAAAAPIVNTGVFILGTLALSGLIFESLGIVSDSSPLYVIITMFVGINFFVELAINLVLSPAIHTVARVVLRRRNLTGRE